MNKHSFRTTRNRVKRTVRKVRSTRAAPDSAHRACITRHSLTALRRNDVSRRDSHSQNPTTKEFGARSDKKSEPCYLKLNDSKNTWNEIFYRPETSFQNNKSTWEISISKWIKWNTAIKCTIIVSALYKIFLYHSSKILIYHDVKKTLTICFADLIFFV